MPPATLAPEPETTTDLDAAGLNRRGIRRHVDGNAAGALDDFAEAARLDPEMAEAWNNAGIARQGLGDLPGALDDFGRALALRPDYADARNNRGRARQLAGDLAGAGLDLGLALESARGTGFEATVLHNRASLRIEAGDRPGAIADLDRALRLAPGQAASRIARADARKAVGDLAGAMADLDRALEGTPEAEAAEILHRRGGVRVLLDDFVGALDDYDRALALAPRFWLAHVSRGHARYHLRDPRGLADYRRALAIEPEGTVRELARLFRADVARAPEATLANCEKHLRIDPRDAMAHVRRGLTLLLLGRDPRADLERFAEMAPDLRDHLYRLVDAASERPRPA